MVNWLLDHAWSKKTMSAHKIRSAHQPFLIIVCGRTLVLRANAKKVFLTNRPPRWLALYGYLRGLADNNLNLAKYINFWREARWNCKVSFPPCFSICNGSNDSPRNQQLENSSKIPKPTRGILLPIAEGIRGRESWNNFQFQTQPPLVHILCTFL